MPGSLEAKVSVLMPVGNVRSFLLEAAGSVLAQTHRDLELILIDDVGRKDELAAMVAPLADSRVQVIACDGKGIADALNTGLAHATGDFWCRCDSDDLFPVERLARQIEFLHTHSDFGAICGAMWAMTPDGKFVADLNRKLITEEITDELRHGVFRSSLCTWLVRIAHMRAAGSFRRYFVTAEDIDAQLRLGERCRVWYDSGLAYHYRIHQTSITHVQTSTRRTFFEDAARMFQKQRLAGEIDALDRGQPPTPPPDGLRETAPRSRVQDVLVGASWEKHAEGHKAQALRLGWRACLAKPSNKKAWRNLIALAIKPARG